MLVVGAQVRLRDGDGEDAAEVGQLLLVEALDQAAQVGDVLQLDHLLWGEVKPKREVLFVRT